MYSLLSFSLVLRWFSTVSLAAVSSLSSSFLTLIFSDNKLEWRGARRKTYRVQVGVPVDEAQHYRGLDLDVIERHLHNLLGIEERIIFVHPIEVLSEKDIWLIVFKDNRDLDLVFVAEDDAQHDRGYDLMASQNCSPQDAPTS